MADLDFGAALNLAAAGRRLADTPLPDGTVRTLHALRSGGRAAIGLIGLLLIALTYAGWLHPSGEQRRWKWDVEPSQSMVRAAQRIQKWHDDGTLPPEARLLNLQPEFASYIAWFAPSEKTYFDTRYRFHAEEAAEYLALRRYLAPRPAKERAQDPYDMGAFLRKHNITYAVSAHSRRQWHFAALGALWSNEESAIEPEWVLWHVEGRAVVLGWTKQDAIPQKAFDGLRFDPLKAAYVEAQPLPTPEIRPPLPSRDVWERFVTAPPPTPAQGEEALVLMQYRQSLVNRAVLRHRFALIAMSVFAERLGNRSPAHVWTALIMPQFLPPMMPPEVSAVAALSVRAARKAIASSPDHPDGYYFLAKAYTDSTYYALDAERLLVITVNLGRCRARLPDDPTQRRTSIEVIDLCEELDLAHQKVVPPRLDLKYDVTVLSIKYLEDQIDFLESTLERHSGEMRDRAEKELEIRRKYLTAQYKKVDQGKADLQKSTDKYINAAATLTSPLERAALARQFGLFREAIAELYKEHERFQKQLQNDAEKKQFSSVELAQQFAVYAELIELMMYDGRVEEASQILDTVDTPDSVDLMRTDLIRTEYFKARRRALPLINPRNPPFSPYDDNPAGHFRGLRQAVALATGDFERAVEVMAKDLQAIRTNYTNFKELNFPGGPLPHSMIPPPAHDLINSLDRVFDALYLPVLAPLNPVSAHLGGMARQIHFGKVEQLLAIAEAKVNAHVRLGLTHMEQGDIPSAVHHFQQSLDAPEFREPLENQRIARENLRAIASARGGPGVGP